MEPDDHAMLWWTVALGRGAPPPPAPTAPHDGVTVHHPPGCSGERTRLLLHHDAGEHHPGADRQLLEDLAEVGVDRVP